MEYLTTDNVLPPVDFMLVSEFIKYVPGIAMRTLRRWCETGAIPADKRGSGRWWINLKELRQAKAELEHAPRSFHEAMMMDFDGEME